MAVLSDYTSGTITLANGSTAVTGTGTLFDVAKFREGDTLQIQNLTAVIASVNSNTSLTLTAPWTGTTLTNAPYRARYLPDGARVTAQATTLIELLGNGVLSNLAELGVEEGKTPVGNAAGEYELKDQSTFGVQDPNNSLAKLADLMLAANKVLNTDNNGDLFLSDITPYARTVLSTGNEASARTIMGANRPMFSASASGDISISNGNNTNIPLTNANVNVGNNWNGTRFLCPEAGNYFFSFIAQWNGGGDNTGSGIARLKKNGAFTGTASAASKTLFYVPVCVQAILPLAVGDTVNFDFELVGASGTIVLQTANTRGIGFLIR